jgi:hypothetical protein
MKPLTKHLRVKTNQTYVLHIDRMKRGRHGRDRMVFGFTTTYTISAYHH